MGGLLFGGAVYGSDEFSGLCNRANLVVSRTLNCRGEVRNYKVYRRTGEGVTYLGERTSEKSLLSFCLKLAGLPPQIDLGAVSVTALGVGGGDAGAQRPRAAALTCVSDT